MPNLWLQHNPPEEKGVSDGTPKRRYIPSPEKIRQMAHESSEGGRFVCPKCNVGFSLTYGTFGKFGSFGEATYYCKDCAKLPDFRKVR